MTRVAGTPTSAPADRDSPYVPGRRGPRWRRFMSSFASVALVVGIFWYFLPQYASISAIWSSVTAVSGWSVVLLGLVAAWNLATYALVVVATTPGMTFWQALVSTEASTAVANTVPAGGAVALGLTYSIFGSWGFSRSRTSVSLVVSGLWNNFVKLAMPVLALCLLALQGHPGASRLTAALAGLAVLVVAVVVGALLLSSEDSARRIGLGAARVASQLRRLVRRPPVTGWEMATTKFRRRTALLVHARWPAITVATLVSHVSLFAVLLVALRTLGVPGSQVSWIDALAVFAFARLLTAIPITPGGVGVVEVALIAGLVSAGGDRPTVAAAVLVFRALTYVAPVPIGLLCHQIWRRRRAWRRPPGQAPRSRLVPESS